MQDTQIVTVLGSCNRTGLRKPEISLRSSRGQDLQWQKVTQVWRKGYASLAKVLRKPGESVAQVWRKCCASLAKGLRKPGESVTQAWRKGYASLGKGYASLERVADY